MGSKSLFKKKTIIKFLGLKLFEVQTDAVDRVIDVEDDELLDEIYLYDSGGINNEY